MSDALVEILETHHETINKLADTTNRLIDRQEYLHRVHQSLCEEMVVRIIELEEKVKERRDDMECYSITHGPDGTIETVTIEQGDMRHTFRGKIEHQVERRSGK